MLHAPRLKVEVCDCYRDSAGWNQRYRQKWSWKLRPGNIWPAVDEKDVVVLTDNNFSDFVAENHYVMINFYLHECKWCRKLAPEYAAAATMLKGKAVLAKIDSEERELAVKFNVDGWPTLYLLIGGGSHKILYDSNRTRDAIVNWVNRITNISVQNVTTIEEAETILLQAKSNTVLGMLDSLEGEDSEELAAISKVHVDVKFYQTNVDVGNLFSHQIKRPSLVLLKREGLTPTYFAYEGQFTRLAMGEFVSKHKLPSVIPFTLDNAQRIYNNPIKQLWLFAPQQFQDVISIFEEVEKAFKGKLLFVHVETSKKESYIRNICNQFGITEVFPTVVACHKADFGTKKFKYDGEFSLSGIKSFAEDFLADKFLGKLAAAAT
ncbi:protein disulfide isomerase-like 1-3 isoform X1 [Manihot esculenta]|uniref:protein disulfide isomerase-like 1-3 isoform X1 n=1 Tax=Manihot esculenta TaxID=3983 RepID=UPI001CC74C63|nr:protein disulfide isomerase-like 1-3 isoform X1 [Manihot esculenta]